MTEAVQRAREAFEKWAADPTKADNPCSMLQGLLAVWQNRNFGAQPDWHFVAGQGEEVGEMAEALLMLKVVAASGRVDHALLKHVQGIRGLENREAYLSALGDAIADQVIYLMQLATVNRIDFWTLIRETARDVMKRDWTKKPEGGPR